ncbi:hypothetical protein COLO4_22205 [Corchorus olitorius]|uniref:Uncharacterized protein n=1 Tax=Corchorus olitorius TaxID=93759 RepID=A0A1R3INH7_9ROSI|nr:hypothetical protein COLO4_22205 [Corchorus olitorius]
MRYDEIGGVVIEFRWIAESRLILSVGGGGCKVEG